MHRDTGHEVRSQLARYELAGALELAGVRIDRALNRLLCSQLGELLSHQVMVLSELLQQVMTRCYRRIALLWVWLRLRPRADGLSRSIRKPGEGIHGRGLLSRDLLSRDLLSRELLSRELLSREL